MTCLPGSNPAEWTSRERQRAEQPPLPDGRGSSPRQKDGTTSPPSMVPRLMNTVESINGETKLTCPSQNKKFIPSGCRLAKDRLQKGSERRLTHWSISGTPRLAARGPTLPIE